MNNQIECWSWFYLVNSPRSLTRYIELNLYLKSHQKPPCDVSCSKCCNVVVFVCSLVWTLCFSFQLLRSLATEFPLIKEFTRRRPVVGVIGCRICDSLRITALRQGSMWAIGEGVPCSNSGVRLARLCQLLMVSALMTTLSASVCFDFAAAMICCMVPFGSRRWWCSTWRASLYCFAASAIASRICCFRSRLCTIVAAPFWTPKDDDGWWCCYSSYRRFCCCFLMIVSYRCNFITTSRRILKGKGGITSITSKTYMVLN